MTIGEVYREGKNQLLRSGVESPDFDATCLFQKAFGSGRQDRILHSEEPADGEPSGVYLAMIRERANGRPLQYILGTWPFFGLELEVGEGVLIPREETELLVHTAAGMLMGVPEPRLLDLCSGTGAVAFALATVLPSAEITAVEKYPEAFHFLHKNQIKIGIRTVIPKLADILDPSFAAGFTGVDGITANPPYVKEGDFPSLQREVRREPAAALDGGKDGLRFYRAIARLWVPALRPGGVAAVEIGEGQARQVCEILEKAGLREICVEPDFAGLDRVVSARKP